MADILAMLYPRVPVNIINAGLSGGNAVHALERLERAKNAAKLCGVRVCDVYAKWKLLYDNGVDVT